jgi:hypothetical protein
VRAADLFDARSSGDIPTLAQMNAYDMVFSVSDVDFQDAAELGNNLADYVDQKGTVVASNFSFQDTPANRGIAGRFRTDGYSPFNYNNDFDFTASTLGANDADHPLMQGVTALGATYRHDHTLAPGATLVASWADADTSPLIAFKGRVIGINFHPQESELASWTGDFARVIANAGKWRSVGCPTNTTLHVRKRAEKIRASGRVSPNHSGEEMLVTLRVRTGGPGGGLIVKAKRPHLNSNSKYVTRFNRPNSGRCRIRARFRGHDSHDPVHLPSGEAKSFRC